jgi:hypothetical protein
MRIFFLFFPSLLEVLLEVFSQYESDIIDILWSITNLTSIRAAVKFFDRFFFFFRKHVSHVSTRFPYRVTAGYGFELII